MANMFHASEAASLGLHAAALLARSPERLVPVKELARVLEASAAHLAKVLQALERAGLVKAVRGPSGGFQLARPAARVSLKQVYEAVEGPFGDGRCLFGVRACRGDGCPLGGFTRSLSARIVDRLGRTRLSDVKVKLGR